MVPKATRPAGDVSPRLTAMWDWVLPAYRVIGRSDPEYAYWLRRPAQGGRGGTEADEPPQRRDHRGDQSDREHHHRVRHVEPQPRVGRGGHPLRLRPLAAAQPPRRPGSPPWPSATVPGRRTTAPGPAPGHDRRPAWHQQARRGHAQTTERQEQASRGGHRRGEQVQRLGQRATPRADQEPGPWPAPAPDPGRERLGHGPQPKPEPGAGPEPAGPRSGVPAGQRPAPGRERDRRVSAQQAEGQPGRQQVRDGPDRDQRIPHRVRQELLRRVPERAA